MGITLAERNITRVYRSATDADRMEGSAWYWDARRIAHELDPTDPVRGAAVLAVLSPRLSWTRNVEAARDAYAGRPTRTLYANERKAKSIIAGADPATVVSGPKVTAFWRAITTPDDPAAIVIDRHALDVAAGQVLDDETRDALLRRKGDYARVAELYRRASARLTREYGVVIDPPEVQATTWVAWRRNKRASA